jgi:hypothetical protein
MFHTFQLQSLNRASSLEKKSNQSTDVQIDWSNRDVVQQWRRENRRT